ncbi:MAG: hypothetical protein IIV72_08355 [Alistipes sp.]|nr:hypothetical protein [Alistipes sp.]
MQTNSDIAARFLMAIDSLYATGEIVRFTHLEQELGINHSMLYRLRHDHTRQLHPYWLARLVDKYAVNADWLLLGRGRMFM